LSLCNLIDDTGTLFNTKPFDLSSLPSPLFSVKLGFVSLNQSHGLIILEEISLELSLPEIERLNS